jgi:two-component system heavy metal sensor histidine kinase CusS
MVNATSELWAVRDFFEATASEAGIRLEVEATPGLEFPADRQLVQRALSNLVSNALSHTPSGGTVTLFAAPCGASLQLGVRDTGPGIPPEHVAHVFDRFYRADKARSSGQGRVGLGLAIVKAIAELHNGTATVTRTDHHGTTVTLAFPTGRG